MKLIKAVLLKALFPISQNSISLKQSQFSKADSPIFFVDFGIEIFDIVEDVKASFSIETSSDSFENITSFKFLQSRNADC